MLEDFQTGTASMARKRHLASTARGFSCFCLMTDRTDASHSALLPGRLYHHKMLHVPLRCLEGSTMSNLVHRRRRCARIVLYTILCLEGSTPEDRGGASTPGEGNRCGSRGAYFLLPTAAILFSEGLEGPAKQDWELRHRAAAKTRLEQRPMTEAPRRYAS